MKEKFYAFLKEGKEKFELIKFNFPALVIFEALYMLIGTVIYLPLIQFLMTKSFSFLGYSYIIGENFREVISNPVCIFIFLVYFLLLAFYGLFELTSIILILNESHFRNKATLLPLIKVSVKKTLRIFIPRNFPLIILVLIVIPFTNFSLKSSLMTSLKVPEYIMQYILSVPILHIIYLLLVFALFALVVFWIFALHFFTLEDKSFLESIRSSWELVKGHTIAIVFLVLIWEVIITAAVFLIYLLAHFISAQLLNAVIDNYREISIFVAAFAFIVSSLSTIWELLTSTICLDLISVFFYEYHDYQDRPSNKLTYKGNYPSGLPIQLLIPVGLFISLSVIIINSHSIYDSFDELFVNQTITLPAITAHRGDSVDAPENTLAAFESAIEKQADYVELDVAQTSDGVLVVSHDNNLKRTAGVNVSIWDSNYDEIKDLDVGSFFNSDFNQERIPTLDAVLKLCRGKIKLNIEIKTTGHEINMVDETIAVIQSNQFVQDCLVSSESLDVLTEVEEKYPEIETVYTTPVALGEIEELPVDSFSIESFFVNEQLVSRIHEAEKTLHVWTVDEEELISLMVYLGVDNIITDDVRETQKLVQAQFGSKPLLEALEKYIYKDYMN